MSGELVSSSGSGEGRERVEVVGLKEEVFSREEDVLPMSEEGSSAVVVWGMWRRVSGYSSSKR